MTALELVPATGAPTTLEQAAASWLAGYPVERTRKAYAFDLRDWLRFCHANGVDPYQVNRGHIDAWVLHQQEAGAAPASIKRRVAAIGQWYEHLVEDLEILDKNPARRVKPPRAQATPTIPRLDLPTLARMAGYAAEAGPDLELAFWLMFTNGLRIDEVCRGVRTADVARTPGGELYGIVRGKGGKVRVAVFTHRGAELVEARVWPPLHRMTVLGDRPLVTTGMRTIQRRVVEWGARAGVEGMHCHELRTAALTILQGDDAPDVKLEWVQDFAGHADPRTTRGYDRGKGLIERNPSRVLGALLTQASATSDT